MVDYSTHFSTRETPQSEAIPNKEMVENSAGGYTFAVDDWTRLDRFLILGNEGGSYYASEKQLTIENAQCVLACRGIDEKRTIDRIVEISTEGRAPKNDAAIFALAICSSSPYALSKLNNVCRIGTHLFQFVDSVEKFRGWGRSLRSAVANWYTSKEPDQLAYQLTKYQNRHGWTHHDVLHKCHAKAKFLWMNQAFEYVKNGSLFEGELRTFEAVEEAKRTEDKTTICKLIREDGLVRECIPSKWLNEPEVWDALLENMPLGAMVRNLGKMSNVGLLKPMSVATQSVASKLMDSDAIKKARLHPMSILLASKVYARGSGIRGKLEWNPDATINYALDAAFHLAFDAVEPTGKRHLLALDVSGSMISPIANTFLTCREAAAAMALVTVKTETLTHTVAFTCSDTGSLYRNWRTDTELTPLDFSKATSLNDAVDKTSRLDFGGTDCALPMIYALKNKIEADVFVVYTDSETWHGDIHPCQALQRYREKMGIPAKLIVVGMESNGFTIADPNDAGMMDVVGFDTAVPSIMSDFVR